MDFIHIEFGSGARTKMNRLKKSLPKEHFYDALCVGKSGGEEIKITTNYIQLFKSEGRGTRQMARVDRYGFPLYHLNAEKYTKDGHRKGHRKREKVHKGFATGDIAEVDVTSGKNKGSYKGRVTIRHSGYFGITDWKLGKKIDGISHRYFTLIQRGDGWNYGKKLRPVY